MRVLTPSEALWNQRARLVEREGRLRALRSAVGEPNDLWLFQWAQLFCYTVEFRPDLIIDLGRGHGHSTCCFLEAAKVLRADVVTRECLVVRLMVHSTPVHQET